MPTTLFVLVNAVINSFRLVDHRGDHDQGRPDNASRCCSITSTRSASVSGFRLCRGADGGAAGDAGHAGAGHIRLSRSQDITSELTRNAAQSSSPAFRPRAGDCRGVAAGAALARCRCSTRSGARSIRRPMRRSFSLSAPWTLGQFRHGPGVQAPFGRYYLNTIMLVTMVLAGQLVLSTLAAYAFARFKFPGQRHRCSRWCCVQLMIMPDVLIVENYRTIGALGLLDTIPAIGAALSSPAPSASSCCARPSRAIPQELDDAARVEGARRCRFCGRSTCRSRARPIIAFALVSRQLPLEQFPVAADRHQFGRQPAADRRTAGVLAPETRASTGRSSRPRRCMTTAPLLIAFLLFQRQFVQSFMRAGIR